MKTIWPLYHALNVAKKFLTLHGPVPIAATPSSKKHSPRICPRSHAKANVLFIIAACVLALVAVIGVFVGVQQKQASDRAAYIASLNELRAQTIRGGSVAEKMCNLTKQVWYNTIYEERDSMTRTC